MAAEEIWISVNDRLPELDQEVYAAIRSLTDDGSDPWVIECRYGIQLNHPWGHIVLLARHEAEVYAWMPKTLPKPPKWGRKDE